MARGRAAGYDHQRQTILKHAAELFALRGYSATSMNQVAQACSLSKATIYHYYQDKYELLISIADGHVSRLVALVEDPSVRKLDGEVRLRQLIDRVVIEYADARHAHRVLTEDVKFLKPIDRDRVLDKERRVVAAVAHAVAAARADKQDPRLAKPLTMLLFGMINWMFTWMNRDGLLDYAAMGPIVADLFLGGIDQVRLPESAVHSAARTGPSRQSAVSAAR